MLLGACKPYRKIGALIGALPVGLKGKIYGQPFKVLIQYDAFGGVKAQIYEDEQGGGMITEVTGRKGEVKPKAEALSSWAISRAISQGLVSKGGEAKVKVRSWFEGKSIDEDFDEATIDIKELKKDIYKRSEAFIKNLHQEVIDFNKGKDTKTVKSGPVNIGPKKTATKKQSTPKAKYRTIDIRTYNVPAYTVPKHKRRIKVQ